MTTLQQAQGTRSRRWSLEGIRAGLNGASLVRYALYLYLASRVLYLVIAAVSMLVVDHLGPHTALAGAHNWEYDSLTNSTLGTLMSNWDGKWYLLTSENWYYHHVIRAAGAYTTLGFMPLYPMVMWLFAHVIGNFGSGLLVSMVSGGIATLLIAKLAAGWWGEQGARRGIAYWCFFPGTIVFSMVYSEGMLLSLIAACMLLMQRRRWLWAGVCAGLATAIGPTALSAVPMCAAAALLELYRGGSREVDVAQRLTAEPRQALRTLAAVFRRGLADREARRSLLAPLLSPAGAIGFAIFLWYWTGSPMADYTAQHIEWSESSTPLAVPRVALHFIHQLFVSGVGAHGPGGIDLNGVLALAGTVFLLWAFKLLWQHRQHVPLTAWVWTVCVSVLALTSANTPPNPRLLIVAFPLVLAVGSTLRGRAYNRALGWTLFATVLMSPITYVGLWLRP